MTERQLLDDRNVIYKEQVALGQRIKDEKRGFTPEERAQFDKAEADYKALTDQIETGRTMRARMAEQAEIADRQKEAGERAPADNNEPGNEGGDLNYRKVFNKILRSGRGSLSSAEHKVAREHRAMTKGSDTGGGFLVPDYWDDQIITHMKSYGGLMAAASIDRTTRGGTLYYPVVDDLDNTGEWVAEAAQISMQDVEFSQVAMNDYKVSSKIVLVSLELAQDETYGLENVLTEAFARRIGVTVSSALIAGDGNGKPTGLMTTAQVGHTAAGQDAITPADLIALKHSVDPSYRVGNRGKFLFADSTLASLKLLTIGSGDGRGLWQPSMAVGVPDTIDGSEYVIDQTMQGLGADNAPVAFGDLSKYRIRILKDITNFTFREKYMDQGCIGYMAYMRLDGHLLNTSAVKKMVNASA